MRKRFTLCQWRAWALLPLLLTLGGLPGVRAQSAGPYGNEWLVPGQPYYKIKITQDGLYRLDFAYLSAVGAGSVAPTRLQLWRRGQEVAVFQGGNGAALDNSTFLEFYGQRNDGALDSAYYLNPRRDWANPHFSFFTDTATYFLTWGTRPGKRMAQPVAAGGQPHGWRLQASLSQITESYTEAPYLSFTYQPWIDPGEGFLSAAYPQGSITMPTFPLDSALRAVATGPGMPAPRLRVMLVGSTRVLHRTRVSVVPPGAAVTSGRSLGVIGDTLFNPYGGRFLLQGSDIGPDGQVRVSFQQGPLPVRPTPPPRADLFRVSWWEVVAPQQNVWLGNRRYVAFRNDSTLGGPATYELDNLPATVRGYDVHDPWNVQRIEPTTAQTLPGAGARRFVFPLATGQQERRLLLADAARALVPAPARRVVFRFMDPARPNFVIVTHPQLMGPAVGTSNAARAYATYRASVAGGRYDTLLVTAPQLYDQFHYGERSVLALRRFGRWLAANAPAGQTKYLLLLGRGIIPGVQVSAPSPGSPNPGFGVDSRQSSRFQGERGVDLVPCTTRSPSDNFFSNDWRRARYNPALPTGRVAVVAPQEVMDYLSKLQQHEALLDPNQLDAPAWLKKFVHLVGGKDAGEQATFDYYMDGYRRISEGPLLGARVTTYRNTVAATGTPLNLSAELNAGVSLVRYFGHGSTSTLDLDLGNINDPTLGYNNVGKYPVFVYNGCFAGNAFFNAPSFTRDWLLAPQKGSMGAMAGTGLYTPYFLDLMQTLFDRLLLTDPQWFGKPVAQVHGEAVRRLQTDPNYLYEPNYQSNPLSEMPLAIELLQCALWQGDPAVRLYAPAKPDLVAGPLSLAPIAPAQAVTAASASFNLRITVRNPARITRDSVEIRITRTFPPGSGLPAQQLLRTFRQAYGPDTTYTVALSNPVAGNFAGDNTFRVELDYRNKIDELTKANNTAQLVFSFLRPGLTLLTPQEFAIVATNTPRLVAQRNELAGPVRGYDVQVDSVAGFNSPALQQSLNQQAAGVVSFVPRPLLPAAGRDSVVWYWRVRFTSPQGAEDAGWQTASFRVIAANQAGGWSQSHNGQFNRNDQRGLTVATPGNQWSFAARQAPVVLRTLGGGGPGAAPTFNPRAGLGILTNPSTPPVVSDCAVRAPNLLVTVLSPATLRRVAVPGTYSTCGGAGQTFYHFATDGDTLDNLNNSAARRAQLLAFLGQVPDGSYVLLISQNRLRWASADLAAVRQALQVQLGSARVAGLRNGEALALVARKRTAGGQALAEAAPDRSQPDPASQPLTLNATLAAPGTSGTLTSTLIGPARQWQTLFNTIRRPAPGTTYTLSLLGINAAGQATVLNPNVGAQPLSLSGVSAATYPYLQLQLTTTDTLARVPAQLRQWLVAYQGVPEGVVRRDLVAAAAYDSTRLKNQALTPPGVITFPVKFENVSAQNFQNPLQVRVELLNAADGVPVPGTSELISAPRAPAAGDSAVTIRVRLNLVGRFGRFIPRVIVNPQLQPELYYFNNELRLDPISLRNTTVPPTLDVAVDGRHILDGELVSPRPLIQIQLKDLDRLRPVTSATAFAVFLQRDGQAPVQVDVTGPLVQFSVDNANGSLARLTYQPGLTAPLPDGQYTLRVQARNAAGQAAGPQEFAVKFQVVNASTITNVFPYPNPVTSKARFVFTLTGQELPRDMKIQIMTLTGRVVREIFMAELGPLHIGNNITDFAWDGTDQYGDRLANGTYLYRVSLNDPTNAFSRRATDGDRAFKNDWGKLVLLR